MWVWVWVWMCDLFGNVSVRALCMVGWKFARVLVHMPLHIVPVPWSVFVSHPLSVSPPPPLQQLEEEQQHHVQTTEAMNGLVNLYGTKMAHLVSGHTPIPSSAVRNRVSPLSRSFSLSFSPCSLAPSTSVRLFVSSYGPVSLFVDPLAEPHVRPERRQSYHHLLGLVLRFVAFFRSRVSRHFFVVHCCSMASCGCPFGDVCVCVSVCLFSIVLGRPRMLQKVGATLEENNIKVVYCKGNVLR